MTVINNALADAPPERMNKPEKGPGPILRETVSSDVEQFEKESISSSICCNSPASLRLRIASDMSEASDEPLGNTYNSQQGE